MRCAENDEYECDVLAQEYSYLSFSIGECPYIPRNRMFLGMSTYNHILCATI